MESLILPHALERIAEVHQLEKILLDIFQAEGKEALRVWIKTRLASLIEFKGIF